MAHAETRVALIIGNSNYSSANLRLANPANDAAAMQRALQDAGFQTIVKLDARRLDFYRAVDEFSARIIRDPHSVGLFYYAGHGDACRDNPLRRTRSVARGLARTIEPCGSA